MMWNRMFGPMGWAYWILILTNLAIPLTTLWSRKLRVNALFLFLLSFVINTGMWFERFVIVVTSLYRDYLPSSWGTYRATKWDYMTFIGTWGLFTFLFLLFVRFLPMIPMSEIRMMLPQTKMRPGGEDAETVIRGDRLMPPREGIYGLLAEFNTPGELVHATEQAHQAGYRRMECYTPYPVEEAAVALRFHKNRVPLVCLLGGLMGVTTAFLMETWIAVWSYPLNIAGRPLFSWPAFIIPAYEWTILFSGLSAAFGMIALNGLPQLYHPVFNAPNFRNGATTDKFFLCLEAHDPQFSLDWRRGRFSSSFRRSPSWRWITNARVTGSREQGTGNSDAERCSGVAAVCAFAACWAAGGLPAGHARPAEVHSAARDGVLCGWALGAAAGGEHRGARPAARGHLLLYRPAERQGRRRAALPGDDGGAGARAGAVQHLLHAVPLARGQWRRHDRAARLSAGGQLPHARG